MEKYSLCIIFDHRGRTENGKEGPLEVRVTVGRKPYYINSGIRVRGCEFRFGEIVNRSDMDVLNERLAILEEKIEMAVNMCIEHGEEIRQLEDIRSWVNPRLAKSRLAVSGERLYTILSRLEKTYNTKFYFCSKQQTGRAIIKLLRMYGRR